MEVVTVCCKLPNGLVLRTFGKHTSIQPVVGGGTREVMEYLPNGQSVTIHGNVPPYAKPLVDVNGDPINLEQSFARTENVPAAFWNLWLEQNKDSAVVKHGLIFAHNKPLELRAIAKDHRDRRHGLEPIDPTGDPRNPKNRTQIRGGTVTAVMKADMGALRE